MIVDPIEVNNLKGKYVFREVLTYFGIFIFYTIPCNKKQFLIFLLL